MLQQVKCSCSSSSFSSRSLLWDTAQTGAGKRENTASPRPCGCWWVHRDTLPVLRSPGWGTRKRSSPTTTTAFPWPQGLNAAFVYRQISQERFLLKENRQTQVSVLAQNLPLHKPGDRATLAFATTWHKTQTTGEPLPSSLATAVSEPRGGAGPGQPSWPPCRGCCRDQSGRRIRPRLRCRWRSMGFPARQGRHREARQR